VGFDGEDYFDVTRDLLLLLLLLLLLGRKKGEEMTNTL
jgi:hypothetical protein